MLPARLCAEPARSSTVPALLARLAGLVLCVAVAGCNTRDVGGVTYDGGGDDGPANDGPAPDAWILPDVPPEPDAISTDGVPDACIPLTCTPVGRQFCGRIGDGCGGVLECGDCANSLRCGAHGTDNVCPPAPGSCTPLTCDAAGGGRYCGFIGDGCGGTQDCGGCPTGETCAGAGVANVCAVPPASGCTRLTCSGGVNGQLCGRIGDGCGGALDCDAPCPTGETCGGAGVSGLCGEPPSSCTKIGCNAGGGRYCGPIGDGCGGLLACGDCSGSLTCGGGGTTGLCGAPVGNCTALTCTVTNGRFCGTIGDGCNGTLECGNCPTGQSCGAAGRAGVCAPTAGTCTPITCDHMGGRYCGTIGNGCGGTLACGTACPSGQTCGGGGNAGVCGDGTGGPCENLECMRVTCPNNGKTTISGTVYAPEGTLPLYNAIVYINNKPVDAFDEGASCERCTDKLSGDPIATALTDTNGRFVLENVPVGSNIPLVIQVGKWRRQLTVPSTTACMNTPVAASLTRLPRTKAEGNIPKIALDHRGGRPARVPAAQDRDRRQRVHHLGRHRPGTPLFRPRRDQHLQCRRQT